MASVPVPLLDSTTQVCWKRYLGYEELVSRDKANLDIFGCGIRASKGQRTCNPRT